MKIKLSLRFVALTAWIIGVYLAAVIYGGDLQGFLLGVIIVMFPAIISYGRALQFLIGGRQDVFLAIVLCFVLGLIGIDLWIGSEISNLQVILVWLPMYQLCLIVITYHGFVRLTKRGPVSVVFDMGAGKWPDRAFFMSVATLEVLVPALLLTRIQNM